VTAVVTGLRRRRGRVAVELDGAPWRTLPLEAVVTAGMTVGASLDRERVRVLARALRRHCATEVTLRALSRRDRSRAELDRRLTEMGVREGEREDALERATRAGLVDDGRFAARRARSLAERGAGDRWVLDDLGQRGVDPELARAAVAELEPERVRASRIAAARGRSVKTVRYLASRGFAAESLEDLIAEPGSGALR
jgi:SOS response regulatory protein OraA/RecX